MVKQFPEDYSPLYSMVTFSQKPYAEALQEGLRQDALFQHVFKEEGLNQKIEEGLATVQLTNWLKYLEGVNL